jgi:hypothetical protein
MNHKAIDEQVMIRYLLGDLPEEQQRQLEEQYFTDDDCFGQLLALEDELFQHYARGELSPVERAQFERRFLTSPEGRQRVEFARALSRAVAAAGTPRVETAPPETARPGLIARLSSLLTVPPATKRALQGAAAAIVLIVVGGAWWMEARNKELRAQLAQLQAEQQTLQRQIAGQRAYSDELSEQLQRERNEREQWEQELAQPRLPGRTIISFILPAGSLRGGHQQKRLAIPPSAHSVKLQLDGEAGYKSYRAAIRTAGGDEVWSQTGLLARSTDWGLAVVLTVPASVLATGDYELALSGVTAQGEFEVVDYYRFTVVKR